MKRKFNLKNSFFKVYNCIIQSSDASKWLVRAIPFEKFTSMSWNFLKREIFRKVGNNPENSTRHVLASCSWWTLSRFISPFLFVSSCSVGKDVTLAASSRPSPKKDVEWQEIWPRPSALTLASLTLYTWLIYTDNVLSSSRTAGILFLLYIRWKLYLTQRLTGAVDFGWLVAWGSTWFRGIASSWLVLH